MTIVAFDYSSKVLISSQAKLKKLASKLKMSARKNKKVSLTLSSAHDVIAWLLTASIINELVLHNFRL